MIERSPCERLLSFGDKMSKTYTVASMFAGIGGIDLAFEQAGFKVIWANEIDKHACRTYRLNFGDEYLVEGDIQNVNTDDIPDFDILISGFPCQAFSSVGLEKGFEDPRGNLFFETARVIAVRKPKVVFFENVANLIKHDDGRTFLTIFNTLAELGYCVKYKVMNASDYGIPQQRNRIYIAAFLDESVCERFNFPEERPLTIDAFSCFDKERQPDSYYMDGHRMWNDMIAFMTDHHRIYRFTDWGLSKGRDGICPTLLAAMGSPYERIPFFWDDFSIRKITQREAARLQGFPDSFQFPMQKTPKQVYKQIGNSVCVPVVKEIADNIMMVLSENGVIMNKDDIEQAYELVVRYFNEHLKDKGVKLPALTEGGKFVKDALVLAYLSQGYPNTKVVTKAELTKFIRNYFPETNDVQQARHLGKQKGWFIISGTRDRNGVLKSGEYKLVTLETPFPGYQQKRRNVTVTEDSWEKMKREYGYRCACCGSKEGEANIYSQTSITVLQKGHMDPSKELTEDNMIPQCELCNRPDRNWWIFNKTGRVIAVADPQVILRSSEEVQREMYEILKKKYGKDE